MKIQGAAKLAELYYGSLSDDLKVLDVQRRKILLRFLLVNVLLAAVAVAALLYASKHLRGTAPHIVILFGWGAAVKFFYDWMTENYRSAFKAGVIRPLVHAIAPGQLHYYPANYVSQYHFQRSHLLPGPLDDYGGSDLVRGEIDGVALQFSGVRAQRHVEEESALESFAHTRIGEKILRFVLRKKRMFRFQGLFMVAEFSKHFNAITHVLPGAFDTGDRFALLRWVQESPRESWLHHDQRIRMDSPAFEKRFNVYGSDSIETHYLLTHSMMEQILHLQQLLGDRPLFLSFSGGHLYLAVLYDSDELFSPPLFTSPRSYKVALDYISTLRGTIGIVEELRLNERIWSKAEGKRSDVERFLNDFDAALSPRPGGGITDTGNDS